MSFTSLDDNNDSQSKASDEGTADALNDLFPGDVELVYSPKLSTKNNRRANHLADLPHTKGTTFLNLPRELRDQIYSFALQSTQHWKIGARERLPRLYHRMPYLSAEILETHYRENTLRFVATRQDNFPSLLKWLQKRGDALTKNVRKLEIVHRIMSNTAWYLPYHRYLKLTTVSVNPAGELEVSTSECRPLIRSSLDGPRWNERDKPVLVEACQCSLPALVHERLSRDDARADPLCVERLEMSTRLGPVLGFAVQMCEALRLMFAHEDPVREMATAEMMEYMPTLLTECVLCGRAKWAFFY